MLENFDGNRRLAHGLFLNGLFFHSFGFGGFHGGFGTAAWAHDPVHRMGVAYPNRTVARQFHPAFYAARPHPSVAQVQTQFHASAQHFSADHSAAVDHFGHRDIQGGSINRNHSAFGGVGQGARAQAYIEAARHAAAALARRTRDRSTLFPKIVVEDT